uniref:Uncharacterized protein n=1 Tax=Arundo donax TaxID=35708 RepID=A0A0A9AIW0_ARUDO
MTTATRSSPPSSASAPPPARRRSPRPHRPPPRWRSPWCSLGGRTSRPFSTIRWRPRRTTRSVTHETPSPPASLSATTATDGR